jgi:hypothetical protein
MRISPAVFMIGVAVLGSGISSAAARNATQLEEHFSYSGCYCQFGYGGSALTLSSAPARAADVRALV